MELWEIYYTTTIYSWSTWYSYTPLLTILAFYLTWCDYLSNNQNYINPLSKRGYKVYVAQYQHVGKLQSLFSWGISPPDILKLIYWWDISLTILLTPHSRSEKPQQHSRCWSSGCAALEWWQCRAGVAMRRYPVPKGKGEAPARW